MTTVSLVLNGRGEELKIAPATRDRVLAAARELRYIPNAAARALAGRDNRTIGLIIASPPESLRMPVFSDVAMAAVTRAQELGYFVLLIPVAADSAADPLAAVRDASIAGVICEARGHSRSLGMELKDAGIPLVWIRQARRSPAAFEGPTIDIDERPGVVDLAGHLDESGIRAVHLLVPDAENEADAHRFAPLLEHFGNAAHVIACDGWTSADGRAAMESVLASGARPEAVFAGNDLVAAGALHACRDAGLRVPQDVRLAGFGDFALGPDLDPPLTTVAWPLQQMAHRAVDGLVHQLQDRQADTTETLATELVIRSSA